MQKSLFPSEIIKHTSEQILSRHSRKSHVIYCTVVLAVVIALALLPILKVTVSVQSNGIIRPVTEKNEIKSLVSGTVSDIFIKENQKVEKDQIILALDSSVLDQKLQFITYEEKEKKDFIEDLKLLTSASANLSIDTDSLKTMHYKSEYFYFMNQIRENRHKHEKSKKELERFRYLHKEKLSSLSELEYKELEVSQLEIQHNLLNEQQLEKWYKELLSCRLKLRDLLSQREQIEKEKELYAIKSPIAGTVEQFSGISIGSYVQAGQSLVVISPDTELIVEVYVMPNDIGLLSIGTNANIQIDAFNYNQWGLISGTIKEISDDFILVDNQPVFRVRCRLHQKYLQLKNGYKGYLKKGMTVRSRFFITERSLFQLLYDNIDDWLNPLQKSG